MTPCVDDSPQDWLIGPVWVISGSPIGALGFLTRALTVFKIDSISASSNLRRAAGTRESPLLLGCWGDDVAQRRSCFMAFFRKVRVDLSSAPRHQSCYILVVSMKNYDNYEKRTQKNGKVKGWKQLPYVAILSFRQFPSSPEKGNAWPHQKCHFWEGELNPQPFHPLNPL